MPPGVSGSLYTGEALLGRQRGGSVRTVHGKGSFEGLLPPKIMVLTSYAGPTGYEVLKAVHADVKTRHLPVIVFSTSSAQKDVNLAYALGANACFAKPVTLEMYISKLRIIIQHWLDLALLPAPKVGQPALGVFRAAGRR